MLKVRPKIIYPKHERDHAFLFSEGGKNLKTYNCSHTFMYGNQINKDQQSMTQRSDGVNSDNNNISNSHRKSLEEMLSYEEALAKERLRREQDPR